MRIEDDYGQKDTSAVWVLPVPFEMTSCFIEGSAWGPAEIIEASVQLEYYDDYVDAEGGFQYGIYTFPPFYPPRDSVKGALDTITDFVKTVPVEDHMLVTLGGEHSITPGVIAGLADRYHDLVIVQLDAHCDLVSSYDGTRWSHACAMRNCLPYIQGLLQLGIRSYGQEEADLIAQSDKVKVWKAEAMYRDKEHHYLDELREAVAGKNVYLTIDIDGLDIFVVSDVGTPYPGGIGWYEALDIIRTVAQHAHVVAFDCVEFAPFERSAPAKAAAHSVAALIYKTMNAIMLKRGKITPNSSPK
jgi:agmatinase